LAYRLYPKKENERRWFLFTLRVEAESVSEPIHSGIEDGVTSSLVVLKFKQPHGELKKNRLSTKSSAFEITIAIYNTY
jgi:hypothetical protein